MADESAEVIPVSKVTADPMVQIRVIDAGLVDEYVEAMKAKAVFPPIKVVKDSDQFWLYSGFHRFAAAKKIGATKMRALVTIGTKRDAMFLACGTNATHGMRRTIADRRNAVRRFCDLLAESGELKEAPTKLIADRCKVSWALAAEIRDHMLGETVQAPAAQVNIDEMNTPTPELTPEEEDAIRGADPEPEEPKRRGKKAAAKPKMIEAPSFDDARIDLLFGQLVRALDERKSLVKRKAGHRRCIEALDVFYEAWKEWKAEVDEESQ